jgi:hypothetical protein
LGQVFDSNRMRSTPTGEVLLRAPKVVDKQHPIRYDPIDKWYNIVPGLLSSMRSKVTRHATNQLFLGLPRFLLLTREMNTNTANVAGTISYADPTVSFPFTKVCTIHELDKLCLAIFLKLNFVATVKV